MPYRPRQSLFMTACHALWVSFSYAVHRRSNILMETEDSGRPKSIASPTIPRTNTCARVTLWLNDVRRRTNKFGLEILPEYSVFGPDIVKVLVRVALVVTSKNSRNAMLHPANEICKCLGSPVRHSGGASCRRHGGETLSDISANN